MKRLVATAIVFSVLAAAAALLATGDSTPVTRAPPEKKSVAQSCHWLAGDLGVQTEYSTGRPSLSDTESLQFLTVADQAQLARDRGLDFVAITDAETVATTDDPDYGSPGLIWIPGYKSKPPTSASLLGFDQVTGNPRSVGDFEDLAGVVHDAGGVIQADNPGDGTWRRSLGTAFSPDAVEVWVTGPWGYAPPELHKHGEVAMAFYDDLLDRGNKAALTGGSNTFMRSTTAVVGVGEPTTWVCSETNTSEGILAGVRAGLTTISGEPPTVDISFSAGGVPIDVSDHSPPETKSPFAFLEADENGDGRFESLIGERVPSGSRLRIAVFHASLARYRVIGNNSEVVAEGVIGGAEFGDEFTVPRGTTWVRAEVFVPYAKGETDVEACAALKAKPGDVASYCDDRIGILAVTSPLYIGK